MTWQPQQQGLEEVLSMLRSSSSGDSEVQKAVSLRLEELRFNPDFLAYLALVLIHQQNELDSHRAVAGLLLKNSINARDLSQENASEGEKQAVAYVKSTILAGLQDKDQMIRQTVGAVITSLLTAEQPGGWPEALEALTTGKGSQDMNVVESVFYTLEKITEDCPPKLDVTIQGVNLLDHLVPEFIKFTAHSSAKIRNHSLSSLYSLASVHAPQLSANIDGYIRCLFDRASDDNAEVRRSVCTALGLMLTTRPDKLVPEMNNVVDYMAYCTKSEDEAVALEACEFWLTFAEDPNLKDQLQLYIGKIAPLLLDGMVYSEYELMYLDVDEEDEAVPDKDTDIKPKAYSGKVHAGHETNDPSANNTAGKSREAADKALEDDDEDDEDYYDDDDDDEAGEWNVRKCSAAALDVMAVSFGGSLLEILMPHLQQRLFSEDEWEKKESAILALGAVAEGCIDHLTPHLGELVGWLIGTLQHKKALVRSITCWTLGRYSSWIVSSAASKEQHFIPTMEGLLRTVLDSNKKVQEAGCSAFATLEEEAGAELVPFLEPILRNLTHAFTKYQQKNLLILYDAIGTLADAVGSALGQPLYMQILMPPMIERWLKLGDQDLDLVPLLECLSSVSIAASGAFAEYAQPVYQRCLSIIHTTLTQYQQFEANPEQYEEPDQTFIVVSLDLLSGLTQGLGNNISQLISSNQPPLLHLMAVCLTHQEASVRQSAHALLGDLAISCFDLLKPVIPQIVPSVIQQIEPEPELERISVCNNAAWATGEIALQCVGDSAVIEPFIPELMNRLCTILLNPKSQKSLAENAAVTIGRLGLVTPALIAPQLPQFAQAWCTALWEIKDNDEKDSAFRGFCMMIAANPSGIQDSFMWFCNAVCKWQHPSAHLDAMFRQILQGYKSSLGAGWEQLASSFPPVLRQRLRERYEV